VPQQLILPSTLPSESSSTSALILTKIVSLAPLSPKESRYQGSIEFKRLAKHHIVGGGDERVLIDDYTVTLASPLRLAQIQSTQDEMMDSVVN
jgi:hypothetical protein